MSDIQPPEDLDLLGGTDYVGEHPDEPEVEPVQPEEDE